VCDNSPLPLFPLALRGKSVALKRGRGEEGKRGGLCTWNCTSNKHLNELCMPGQVEVFVCNKTRDLDTCLKNHYDTNSHSHHSLVTLYNPPIFYYLVQPCYLLLPRTTLLPSITSYNTPIFYHLAQHTHLLSPRTTHPSSITSHNTPIFYFLAQPSYLLLPRTTHPYSITSHNTPISITLHNTPIFYHLAQHTHLLLPCTTHPSSITSHNTPILNYLAQPSYLLLPRTTHPYSITSHNTPIFYYLAQHTHLLSPRTTLLSSITSYNPPIFYYLVQPSYLLLPAELLARSSSTLYLSIEHHPLSTNRPQQNSAHLVQHKTLLPAAGDPALTCRTQSHRRLSRKALTYGSNMAGSRGSVTLCVCVCLCVRVCVCFVLKQRWCMDRIWRGAEGVPHCGVCVFSFNAKVVNS